MKRFLNEFIGTFFLVLVVGLAVANAWALAPLAIGATLMVMVYAGGHISGAHYNPAVTLGVWIRGKIRRKDAIGYWISQFVAGIWAAFVSYYLIGHTTLIAPGVGIGTHVALLCEFLFTFALVWVVLNVATTSSTAGNSYYGSAIGFTVMLSAYAVGNMSGGAFNPAVALGHQIVDATMVLKSIATATGAADGAALTYSWVYLVANFAGGLVAGVVYHIIARDDVA